MKYQRNRFYNLLSLLALVIFTSILTSCGSARIASKSDNSLIPTRKSEVLKFLANAENRIVPKTYETKNCKTEVIYDSKSATVKANINFTMGSLTNLSARLTFPPVNVGSLVLSKREARVQSKLMSFEKTLELPVDVNRYLQYALLGDLPPIYEYFGDDDFSHFDIALTSSDEYVLQREEHGVSAYIALNGIDGTLNEMRITYDGYKINMYVKDYKRMSGNLLPSKVNVVALKGSSTKADLTIDISDVTLL